MKNDNTLLLLVAAGVAIYFLSTKKSESAAAANYFGNGGGKVTEYAGAMVNLAQSAANTTSQFTDDINKLISNVNEQRRANKQQNLDAVNDMYANNPMFNSILTFTI